MRHIIITINKRQVTRQQGAKARHVYICYLADLFQWNWDAAALKKLASANLYHMFLLCKPPVLSIPELNVIDINMSEEVLTFYWQTPQL